MKSSLIRVLTPFLVLLAVAIGTPLTAADNPAAAHAHEGAGLKKELIERITPADFLRLTSAPKTVKITVVAAYTTDNYGMNFNGASHGRGAYVIPVGWTVEVDFINPSPVPHSVVIVEREQTKKLQVGEPAFEGASVPNPVTGISGNKASFRFVADEAGDYAVACGFPSHALAGHWIGFEVSASAKAPSLKLGNAEQSAAPPAGQVLCSAEQPRPNFIVINIDDLGYADIGPFGSKLNRTPNLDRMAKEGMRLTSYYAAPVCSPSRAMLMTGCYPKRVLPTPHVLFPAAEVGLHPDEVTVAETLKAAGYATACVGKWHLGDQAPFLPNAQGFDFYFGIPYSNDMGMASEGSKSDLGKPTPKDEPKSRPGKMNPPETGLRGSDQPPLPMLRDGKAIARVKQGEQQRLVADYTREAEAFIRRSKDRPFLLYLPHSSVHFPLYPGQAWAGKSPHGHYSDWVEETDWSVGRILDTLRELGLDRRTLVIFTSDNGGTTRGSNAPLKGHKGSTWEGGVRAPTIAWWPGKIPAGTSSDVITGMFDVHPTLAKLAGAKLPDRKVDGIDLSPVLVGKDGAKGHDEFLYFRGLTLEAVRAGRWKLMLEGSNAPLQSKQPKKEAPLRLYDLEADVGETTDLAAANPDVVQRLLARAAAVDADLGRTETGPGVRPLGRFPNPRPVIGHDGTVRPDAVGTTERFP